MSVQQLEEEYRELCTQESLAVENVLTASSVVKERKQLLRETTLTEEERVRGEVELEFLKLFRAVIQQQLKEATRAKEVKADELVRAVYAISESETE
jgi:hypothetical protein